MLVREPELAELRSLCKAADLGSIGRAARELHLSQPGLSKRLRRLEAVAGTTLLERSTRGVTLTDAGAQLCRAARPLLAAADSVRALMCGYEPRDGRMPIELIAASSAGVEIWPTKSSSASPTYTRGLPNQRSAWPNVVRA
jgi:DNA-binding transcriptional LysR family regulator